MSIHRKVEVVSFGFSCEPEQGFYPPTKAWFASDVIRTGPLGILLVAAACKMHLRTTRGPQILDSPLCKLVSDQMKLWLLQALDGTCLVWLLPDSNRAVCARLKLIPALTLIEKQTTSCMFDIRLVEVISSASLDVWHGGAFPLQGHFPNGLAPNTPFKGEPIWHQPAAKLTSNGATRCNLLVCNRSRNYSF